ncbi:alpha/beta hydrolase [Croceicoccus sp. F390]|uniref:Alpha/beta hydrolase n=1 Tax=Croceicoccus esteveae TaxID=3075597 RepID=A0ABU2ZE31_9SPHN|nr:alpha/beta hydrolase [Croceicoccus sp. F390]MDT0574857.1 alpha/beta hydrolase [Croceicoccus sp. F390]
MHFTSSIIVAAGLRFNVVTAGMAGSGAPPLLMLNGIGFGAGMLERLAAALPGRQIVCPDMPGCGGSPGPKVPYLMPCMAKAVLDIMERLHPGAPFDCFGFSWGGALAQQIAVQAQSRVARLLLIATTSGIPLPVGDPAIFARLLDVREYADASRMRDAFAAMMREGGASAGLLQQFQTPDPTGVAAQLGAISGWSVAALLPFVRVPVLLIGMADDPVVPIAHQRALSCLIPQARTMELRNGGHLVPLASPARITQRILAFLNDGKAEAAA